MHETPRFIVRFAASGYCPASIPAWRTYETEEAAKRAAQRAADRSGEAVEYGKPKFAGGGVIKFSFGICSPPARRTET